MKIFVPKKGDFIALTFDPQSGHEQKGRHPALVISNTLLNEQTGLAIVCPLTTTDRGCPFHLKVAENPRINGFVMTEQIKSVDYHSRQAKIIGEASIELLDEVLSILDACIY